MHSLSVAFPHSAGMHYNKYVMLQRLNDKHKSSHVMQIIFFFSVYKSITYCHLLIYCAKTTKKKNEKTKQKKDQHEKSN